MVDHTIDDVLAAVTASGTRVDSIITFLDAIKAQLGEALSGTKLPVAVQAKVNAIFDSAEASAAKIDTALNANVPPAPPPEPLPPVTQPTPEPPPV